MMLQSAFGRAVILLVAMAAAGSAPAQQPANLVAFAQLQPGLWELRSEGEPVRNLCLPDPALIQLRHRGNTCSRLVIADAKTAATVHYSCPGAGWGRTTIKVETPRLVRIDSQGIAENAPFAFSAEARRVADCPVRSANGSLPRR